MMRLMQTRASLVICCALLLSPSCIQHRPELKEQSATQGQTSENATPASAPQVSSAAALPEPPQIATRFTRSSRRGVVFEGVAFDSRHHQLLVIEQAGGPASLYASAAEAAKSVDGIAAVNGGFFTPTGEPLGLAVSFSKPYGSWNSASSLGSAVWLTDRMGKMRIARRSTLSPREARKMPQLLQSGPFLLDSGRAPRGLDQEKSRARTLILWDGGHYWWIGCTSACSLADCAEILASTSPVAWRPRYAVNLDGGRSSELWVSSAVDGGPVRTRSIWNRPVRNFLVLK
ncbi:MAG: phosphodiester glycosidase family protein [Luteolibacter sp.]